MDGTGKEERCQKNSERNELYEGGGVDTLSELCWAAIRAKVEAFLFFLLCKVGGKIRAWEGESCRLKGRRKGRWREENFAFACFHFFFFNFVLLLLLLIFFRVS